MSSAVLAKWIIELLDYPQRRGQSTMWQPCLVTTWFRCYQPISFYQSHTQIPNEWSPLLSVWPSSLLLTIIIILINRDQHKLWWLQPAVLNKVTTHSPGWLSTASVMWLITAARLSKTIIMIILINIATVIICPDYLLILVMKSFVNALSLTFILC